ncbi:MAG TPA: hypothetical protein VMY87_06900 [Armatimonadota bacterium]|nr:hypothetical protein [Armatimonadota bacterium]
MSDYDSTITQRSVSLRRCTGALWRLFRRSLRWWLIILVLLAAAWLIADRRTNAQLRAEYGKIEAAGEPVTLAELAPEIPPGEKNAADAYLVAFEFMPDDPAFRDIELLHADLDRARQALKTQETSLRLLKKAAAMEHSAFPIDWSRPAYELTFPHFAQMRNAARRLTLEANVLAAGGNPDEALDSIGAAFGMGEHAKADPILIAQLVAYAIDGMAAASLQEVLSTSTPSPAACRKLYNQLGECEFDARMHAALLGERACGHDFFRQVRQSGGAAFGPSLGDVGLAFPPIFLDLYRTLGRPLLNLDELAYLQHMEKVIAGFELPWSGRMSKHTGFDDAEAQFASRHHVISAMVLPVFSRSGLSMRRAEALVAATRAALAAKAFRAQRGRYPDSLADLEAAGWSIPEDPFTGNPLRYRRAGNAFVVWSLGPNIKDDNAAEYDRQNMSYEDGAYDIPFFCDPEWARQQGEERQRGAEETARQAAEAEKEEARRAAERTSARRGRTARGARRGAAASAR